MSSVKQQDQSTGELPASDRSDWIRPEYSRLETGEAEGVDGTGTDAGGLLS